jgi:transcriptional regulator with XRE-family HTH domain
MLAFGQRLLSVRAGVSQSAVARLELGRAGGMPAKRIVAISDALGRTFPLGVCPHEHRCAWQPIGPPPPLTEREKYRELFVELGIDSLPRWRID